MEQKNKISIIVPVYNVEQYLGRCIESIIGQTYQNMEVILVNDGSIDSSKEICERYAQEDERIIVVNQENSGSSVARNSGMEICTGDVIAFLDSDDHIDKSMFQTMIDIMESNDLDVVEISPIIFGNKNGFDNTLAIEDGNTAIKRILRGACFSVWRRIYRKEVVQNMRFIPGIIHQDVFFTIDVMNKVKSIGFLNSPLYFYNTENLSIIRSKYSKNKIETGIRATEYIIENTPKNPSVQEVVKNYVVSYYTDHYFLLSRNKHVDPQKKYRRKIRKAILDAVNFKRLSLRTFLVIFMPSLIVEIISSVNQKLK
ncbi:glycosyltransferase [Flagellimonas olearia]|uniref:Glycosyltransferase 2-like domain-containing protein n=1 Tax=Flagellimonas olearia TaxID=552546 RepID=A0A444VKX4_9FLAO|nr:glycosyltransferase [Allomuricauda olearia]RYC51426.1 hypothetical protein DN53_14615 [Allomuricauda olearia]